MSLLGRLKYGVRDLDDRPLAEYELVGETDGRPSIRVVSIIATKSFAPIALRTSSQRKGGLVRIYAISNGERLLRSPNLRNHRTLQPSTFY